MTKKAIILGSGINFFEDRKPLESIPYTAIPGWPLGKVKGHKGLLEKYEDIWVLRGRAHIYEGFTWEQACFPTQYLADNGIEELIITNAAGGINPDFEVGDLMQIIGYINFLEPGRKRGNLGELTQSIKYIPDICTFAPAAENTISINPHKQSNEHKETSNQMHGYRIKRGVYIGVHGPNYETDAEVKLFRALGADAVGMSTIPELETAIKNNMKIFAVSVITNVYGKTADLGHEGVLATAKRASARLAKLDCFASLTMT